MIDDWQRVETGVAGNEIGFRTYVYELNKNYILVRNTSTFPVSDKKPYGEVSRDFRPLSFNSKDTNLIYGSFNVEGFTNIYLLDKDASTQTEFVFITREIETKSKKDIVVQSIAILSIFAISMRVKL